MRLLRCSVTWVMQIIKPFREGSCIIRTIRICLLHMSCDQYANHVSAGLCALGSLSISKLLESSAGESLRPLPGSQQSKSWQVKHRHQGTWRCCCHWQALLHCGPRKTTTTRQRAGRQPGGLALQTKSAEAA